MTQSFQSNSRPSSDRMRDEELINEDDTTFDDPRIARERTEERERAEARDVARDRAEQASREGNREANTPGSLGTSYLGDRSTEESWQQWRKIQADFVDNPRDAVSDANGLVGELIENIVRQFNAEKSQMEQRWSSGEDVSTEDLRKCLQTYRDFFGRLLAQADVKN